MRKRKEIEKIEMGAVPPRLWRFADEIEQGIAQ